LVRELIDEIDTKDIKGVYIAIKRRRANKPMVYDLKLETTESLVRVGIIKMLLQSINRERLSGLLVEIRERVHKHNVVTMRVTAIEHAEKYEWDEKRPKLEWKNEITL